MLARLEFPGHFASIGVETLMPRLTTMSPMVHVELKEGQAEPEIPPCASSVRRGRAVDLFFDTTEARDRTLAALRADGYEATPTTSLPISFGGAEGDY